MIEMLMQLTLAIVLSTYVIVLTPSIGMVCLLVSTGLIVLVLFLVFKMKMGALILSLIVVGGLFVLLSFVILSMPWDYSKVVELKDMSFVMVQSFGCCFWPYEMVKFHSIQMDWMVSSWYNVVFIYLILFLLISLGIFYSLIKVSKGTSFGKF